MLALEANKKENQQLSSKKIVSGSCYLFTTLLRHFAIKLYQNMRQFENMHMLKTLNLCVFETI